jgi:hypothetical protein
MPASAAMRSAGGAFTSAITLRYRAAASANVSGGMSMAASTSGTSPIRSSMKRLGSPRRDGPGEVVTMQRSVARVSAT